MSGSRIASLMEETQPSDRTTGQRRGVFIYAQASLESLASKLTERFCVRVRGPHHYSFETMQQQEVAIQQEDKLASDVYQTRLQEDRLAGVNDSDDRDDAGNYRVFVVSEPQSDEERRALAAISTSLVTSAINDPSHTVAAFLPVGNTESQGIPNNDAVQQPIWGGLRSLLDNLGIVSFESMDQLESHLLTA